MVQWQAPAIPVGVQLCGYQVFFKPRLNATAHWGSKITCNSTLNVTLKSLQKYTDYEIMVSAFNSLGLGNSSEVATSFTDEDSEWKYARFVLFIAYSDSFVCFLIRVLSVCLCNVFYL